MRFPKILFCFLLAAAPIAAQDTYDVFIGKLSEAERLRDDKGYEKALRDNPTFALLLFRELARTASINPDKADVTALEQLRNTASLPFIFRWLAVMPDVHTGKGATIGSVVPTRKAIIPAAVGVDIGCGMMAVQTSLRAVDLPDSLRALRLAIESAVPHGRSVTRGGRDKGAWGNPPESQREVWKQTLGGRFQAIVDKHPQIGHSNHLAHLGTLGTGNHFIELCLDEAWRTRTATP